MLATLRVNWLILSISLRERLMYRGDFAFATLVRFLPLVTQIFLWGAIFGVSEVAGNGGTINGYLYPDMVAYYLLANLARAFSSMPGLSNSVARDIRDGSIKRYLTQPVDLLGYLFWGRLAHKLAYYVMAIGPFALVFWLCRSYFVQSPSWLVIGGYCVSLILAFLLGFLIETLIGLVGFWFLEIGSLVFVFMMLNYFLSGHMLPLDFLTAHLPAPVSAVILYLPFQYLAYFPTAVMLNRYTPDELATHLLIEVAWVVALLVLTRWMLARGIRRYSAFGG